ncbi:hypothetical protein EOM86_14930, partial [Candidatus Nomurabacteria bacterium]|nr:hypothetical protein [Candidatus Nomurabacteria bacterium]
MRDGIPGVRLTSKGKQTQIYLSEALPVKAGEKYVFTAPRVIRFTDRDIKTGESIDVYVSQAGKVYASAHNNPSQIPSISLSSEEAVTMAFRSLAQFSDADSAAFSVVKLQHQDTPSHRIWNVELQDRSIALNKDASYGYNIEIQGSTVTQALPYFLIPSATEQAIDQNIITVKWIKFSALVVILLFSLSGIKLLFTLSKQGKDVWRSFGFILMIFYFTRENNVSHYRDLIAMVGIEIGFIAYLLALCFFASIVVLFFFSAPSVRLARPSIKGISSQLIPPSLFLIYIIATRYGYRDLTYILSFSYIFDSGFNFFSQIVSILFFIMASIGFIQYFK